MGCDYRDGNRVGHSQAETQQRQIVDTGPDTANTAQSQPLAAVHLWKVPSRGVARQMCTEVVMQGRASATTGGAVWPHLKQ